VATTMLFYMTCSLSISMLLNVYNRRIQLRER
jgi:ABC-type amino acid transport system permease subunit